MTLKDSDKIRNDLAGLLRMWEADDRDPTIIVIEARRFYLKVKECLDYAIKKSSEESKG